MSSAGKRNIKLFIPMKQTNEYLAITVLEEIPETCQPEYQAASRAYMRYHNMNPIWGISAKKVRGLDDH